MNRTKLTVLAVFSAAALVTSACGRTDDSSSAPPRTPGSGTGSSDQHSLQPGTYYIDAGRVWDLNDGCNRNPLDPQNSVEARPFTLTNDGNGHITLDACNYNGSGLAGDVLDNAGVLSVHHTNFLEANGAASDQDCRMEITVTGNNTFEGSYSKKESNRNQALQDLTVNTDSCTTSFKLQMSRR